MGIRSAKFSMRAAQQKLSEVETLHSYLGQVISTINHCLDCMGVNREDSIMYGMKEIGKYNVDYEGLSYDGKIPYQMVIIAEFDGDKELSRKRFYFRDNIGLNRFYIMPPLGTEEQIEDILQYPDNSKIRVYNQMVIERE